MNKEEENNLSYIGFLKATKISDIGIAGGMAGNFTMKTISKKTLQRQNIEQSWKTNNCKIEQ